MRVLLDECIRGKKNGELLQLAASGFNVFVTIDKGLEFQQRIAHLRLGVVTLVAPSNEFEVLRPLMPRLRHAVMKVKPGQVIRVEA